MTVPPALPLLPVEADGWSGSPGIAGHRVGSGGASPSLTQVTVGYDVSEGSGGTVTSRASGAGLSVVLTIASPSCTSAPPTTRPGRVRLPGLDAARSYEVRVLDDVGPVNSFRDADPSWTADGVRLPGSVLGAIGLPMPVLVPGAAVLVDVRTG